MSTTPTLSDQTSLLGDGNANSGVSTKKLVVILVALYSALILAAIDTTVVSTLMGHIASDLKALDNISWVATSYTVAYSAFQPLYGKLSDIFGRKRISVCCTLTFGAGCLMCGISGGLKLLILGRFVSGMGAGGMLSMSAVTVSDYIPLRKRGVFQGIANICFAFGASFGGIFGGWLTEIGGWRLAFQAQVPLALICAAVIWVAVVEKKNNSEDGPGSGHEENAMTSTSIERIDIVGSLALVSSLLLFMMGTTAGGNQFPWFSLPIVLFFSFSGVLLFLFYYWEAKKAIEPVMPIEVIFHRTVMSACLTNFFGSALMYTFFYYGPLFLQAVYGYEFFDVSPCVLINIIGGALGSLGSGLYMHHTGKYWTAGIISSIVMLLASMMFSAGTILWFQLTTKTWYHWLAFLISGAGYGSMLTITLIALIAAVAPELQATTTAASFTFRGAGSSIGLAASAAILQNVLLAQLTKRLPKNEHTQKIINDLTKSVEAIRDVPKEYVSAVAASYRNVEASVFSFVSVLGIICIVTSVFQSEHGLERDSFERERIEQLVEGTVAEPAAEV